MIRRGTIQSFTSFSNSSVVMPACAAITISSIARSPPASALYRHREHRRGSFSFHSGCWGASAFTRSRKMNWNYLGFRSTVSVVAQRRRFAHQVGRSQTSLLVTLSTNSTTDFLGAPAFQDGASRGTWATVVVMASEHTTAAVFGLSPHNKGGNGQRMKAPKEFFTYILHSH